MVAFITGRGPGCTQRLQRARTAARAPSCPLLTPGGGGGLGFFGLFGWVHLGMVHRCLTINSCHSADVVRTRCHSRAVHSLCDDIDVATSHCLDKDPVFRGFHIPFSCLDEYLECNSVDEADQDSSLILFAKLREARLHIDLIFSGSLAYHKARRIQCLDGLTWVMYGNAGWRRGCSTCTTTILVTFCAVLWILPTNQ